MSCIKYVLATPWNQIVADWKEYKKLCKQMEEADIKQGRAYVDITYVCVVGESILSPKGCIKYKVAMPNIYTEIGDNICDIDRLYCSQFNRSYNENGCYLSECPYVEKNHAYHAARQEFEQAEARRNVFWKNKFSKVK